MLDELHPNYQAKIARTVAGFEPRVARLEDDIRTLKAMILDQQDTIQKLHRKIDDLRVSGVAAPVVATIGPSGVTKTEPQEIALVQTPPVESEMSIESVDPTVDPQITEASTPEVTRRSAGRPRKNS